MPTKERTNKQTPTPTQRIIQACLKKGGFAWVREGPGETYKSNSVLDKSACFVIESISSDNQWLKINSGWVNINSFEFTDNPIQTTSTPFPTQLPSLIPKTSTIVYTPTKPNDSIMTNIFHTQELFQSLGFQFKNEIISENSYQTTGIRTGEYVSLRWKITNGTLAEAEILIPLIAKDDEETKKNLNYIQKFKDTMLPDWIESDTWMQESILKIGKSYQEGKTFSMETTTYKGFFISLGYYKQQNYLSFSFGPKSDN